MADVEPQTSEGSISETSLKLYAIRRPPYTRWARNGPDPAGADPYPDPEDFPTVSPPQEPLPAGWEIHWNKHYRLPWCNNPFRREVSWQWPWVRPEHDYSDWVIMMGNIQHTCLRMVTDPNSAFFEHPLALMGGWVVGIVCPQTQFGVDDTYNTFGQQPSADEAADLTARGEHVTMLTLDML